MTLTLNILSALALLAVLLAAIVLFARRHGRGHITFAQRVIRALYRVADWLEDLAIAVDRGYLAYRMERSINEVEPENERWSGPAALTEAQS